MTNEELIQRVAAGDEAALTLLCENNRGLIRRLALRTARRFNCIRLTERNAYTGYTKEMLSELESEGMLALIECVRSGAYDSVCGAFTTFAVPYLNAAMYRYMESSLGTLSLGRRSMAAVRQVHRLFYGEQKSIQQIAEQLNIPVSAAARHLASIPRLTAKYQRGGIEAICGNHYGGNRKNMTYEEEATLLEPFREKAQKGQIVEISEIKASYEQAVGHAIGSGQLYRMLRRHHWRIVMPRSKHPKKASDEAIEASKKLN